MKTMTCRQLGGVCNEKFHAETFEEMATLSKNHGMEMAQKDDKDHIEVMEKMKKGMGDLVAMKKWMEEKQKQFDDLPTDR